MNKVRNCFGRYDDTQMACIPDCPAAVMCHEHATVLSQVAELEHSLALANAAREKAERERDEAVDALLDCAPDGANAYPVGSEGVQMAATAIHTARIAAGTALADALELLATLRHGYHGAQAADDESTWDILIRVPFGVPVSASFNDTVGRARDALKSAGLLPEVK